MMKPFRNVDVKRPPKITFAIGLCISLPGRSPLRASGISASALETNKIYLELLNVRTEARMNQTALNNKLKELLVLNGNQPLTPGRPRPDTTPDAQTLGLTEYPAVPLPADFHPLADELLASDPTLQSLQGESSAARKQISASKQGWLPKLELG